MSRYSVVARPVLAASALLFLLLGTSWAQNEGMTQAEAKAELEAIKAELEAGIQEIQDKENATLEELGDAFQLAAILDIIGLAEKAGGAVGAGPQGAFVPQDPFYRRPGSGTKPEQWALRQMKLDPDLHSTLVAEIAVKKAAPLTIALIDTGVDLKHPELQGQLWTNPKEIPNNGKDDDGNGYVDDVHGYDFYAGKPAIDDTHGHGTYIAGIIGARWDNQGIAGLNPHVKLMVLKAADAKGRSWSWAVARAANYAVKHGAKIIHISAAMSPPTPLEIVAVLKAQKAGCLVVAPANSHSLNVKNISPACIPGVLAVGAADRNDQRLKSSGWGQNLTLAAPGVEVLGLRAAGTDFLAYMAGKDPRKDPSGAIVEDKYYLCDGTCAGAPLVTGVASLIWAKNPKLTATQVRRMLEMSCDDIDQPGWDIKTGAGRLNVARALQADPKNFLLARISDVTPVKKDGQPVLEVKGMALGTQLKQWRLQLAFGRNPDEKAWQTLVASDKLTIGKSLGTIPQFLLDQSGTWSLRCIAEDKQGQTRQAVMTVRVQ